ncbi:DNA-binding protein [Aggregatibacter actinomycetemcomitans]|nr:DNA-binding protein [Aggregatibacter actinomycetemcomitans]
MRALKAWSLLLASPPARRYGSVGVSYQAVSNAIKHGKSSQRIAKAIALAIDQPLETVFPHYAQKKQKQIFRKKKVNQLKSQFSQIL